MERASVTPGPIAVAQRSAGYAPAEIAAGDSAAEHATATGQNATAEPAVRFGRQQGIEEPAVAAAVPVVVAAAVPVVVAAVVAAVAGKRHRTRPRTVELAVLGLAVLGLARLGLGGLLVARPRAAAGAAATPPLPTPPPTPRYRTAPRPRPHAGPERRQSRHATVGRPARQLTRR
jgi:hypothetical protein